MHTVTNAWTMDLVVVVCWKWRGNSILLISVPPFAYTVLHHCSLVLRGLSWHQTKTITFTEQWYVFSGIAWVASAPPPGEKRDCASNLCPKMSWQAKKSKGLCIIFPHSNDRFRKGTYNSSLWMTYVRLFFDLHYLVFTWNLRPT